MAGPTQSFLAEGSTNISGYLDGNGYFVQSMAASSNPAITNSGGWSNSTTANTALSSNCAGYGTTVLSGIVSGTISAGAITFEVFDGTNWWPTNDVTRIGSFTVEGQTYSLANGSQAWLINTAGMTQVRARLSTVITGSGTWTMQLLVQAMNPSKSTNASLATLLAGEDLVNNVLKVEQRFSYANVTATGTTTVKSSGGFVHSIVINNPSALVSATTATTIAIYDNTAGSGALIGTISLPVSASIASAMPVSVPINSSFGTGLTLKITLGTSGSWTPDITVNYR